MSDNTINSNLIQIKFASTITIDGLHFLEVNDVEDEIIEYAQRLPMISIIGQQINAINTGSTLEIKNVDLIGT